MSNFIPKAFLCLLLFSLKFYLNFTVSIEIQGVSSTDCNFQGLSRSWSLPNHVGKHFCHWYIYWDNSWCLYSQNVYLDKLCKTQVQMLKCKHGKSCFNAAFHTCVSSHARHQLIQPMLLTEDSNQVSPITQIDTHSMEQYCRNDNTNEWSYVLLLHIFYRNFCGSV